MGEMHTVFHKVRVLMDLEKSMRGHLSRGPVGDDERLIYYVRLIRGVKLNIYIFIYLFVYFIDIFIHVFIYLFFYLFVYLFILFIYLFIDLFI